MEVVKSKHITELAEDGEYTMEMLLELSVKTNMNLVPKHDNNTKSLEQFCKDTVATIWHNHGGCHVGKFVDGDYRVLGFDRLRIVDGSTYSVSPGTNPQGTVMMTGRYINLVIYL